MQNGCLVAIGQAGILRLLFLQARMHMHMHMKIVRVSTSIADMQDALSQCGMPRVALKEP